jgi:hypothetical protein
MGLDARLRDLMRDQRKESRWWSRTGSLVMVGCLVVVGCAVAAVVRLATFRTSADPTGADQTCLFEPQGVTGPEKERSMLGRSIQCLSVYANATHTWAQWTEPWFIGSTKPSFAYQDWLAAGHGKRQLILTLSMVPSGAPASWRQAGAAGDYDSHARRLGENLVRAGLGDVVIRLGPEANYESDPGAASNNSIGATTSDAKAWASYWAHVARTLKSVPGSHFHLDWTVNAGYRHVPLQEYYPGSKAVDIIGVDVYDSLADGQRLPANAHRWAVLSSEPSGLLAVARFARANDKPFSVPEWGLVGGGGGNTSGAGDDPYYVERMAALFKADHIAYESYFDTAVGGTLPLAEAPRSLAAYRKDVLGT